MNAYVGATSVYTTAIVHHFQSTWWKKYTLKISLCNCIHTYTDSAELPLQSLVSTAYLVPWWSQMSTASIVPLWSMVSTASLVPWWSLLSNADVLSCTMLVTGVHCKPSPCDMAATSVRSAMLRHTNFYSIATYKLLFHCHWRCEIQGHVYTVSCRQAPQNVETGGDKHEHENNILSSNGVHQKKITGTTYVLATWILCGQQPECHVYQTHLATLCLTCPTSVTTICSSL